MIFTCASVPGAGAEALVLGGCRETLVSGGWGCPVLDAARSSQPQGMAQPLSPADGTVGKMYSRKGKKCQTDCGEEGGKKE